MKKNKVKAFTLIELLVVVAIISILTGVSVLGLQEVRKKAQDTARLSDLKQIEIALETYKSVNNKYPDAGTQGSDDYILGLAPTYTNKLSKDPSGLHDVDEATGKGYFYRVSTDKKSYCFRVRGVVNKPSSQPDLLINVSRADTWKVCRGLEAATL